MENNNNFSPKFYKNKDVTVEAIQFNKDSHIAVWQWLSSFEKIPATLMLYNVRYPVLIFHGPGGDENVQPGSWIVKDKNDSFSLIDDIKFNEMFLKVDNG